MAIQWNMSLWLVFRYHLDLFRDHSVMSQCIWWLLASTKRPPLSTSPFLAQTWPLNEDFTVLYLNIQIYIAAIFLGWRYLGGRGARGGLSSIFTHGVSLEWTGGYYQTDLQPPHGIGRKCPSSNHPWRCPPSHQWLVRCAKSSFPWGPPPPECSCGLGRAWCPKDGQKVVVHNYDQCLLTFSIRCFQIARTKFTIMRGPKQWIKHQKALWNSVN